ncbi:hypothetical protein PHMEG_0002389 [Phytophthora megakarya]|uniref:Reverse transcriptase n=1 Tax=Phytophthora megakarya TaxID=4795 RepID=A0A225WYF6_9STRA|nr:hypothetical protein PHMEG_0002389 [Phytophthora megakarya]
MGSTRRQDRDPRGWRYQIQMHYQQAREQVNQRLRYARSSRICAKARSVWLRRSGAHAVKIEFAGSVYSIFPVVYVSKFKPVR